MELAAREERGEESGSDGRRNEDGSFRLKQGMMKSNLSGNGQFPTLLRSLTRELVKTMDASVSIRLVEKYTAGTRLS